MKALSLWEPWASLLIAGHKRVVTRSSLRTPFRGPIVIHASAPDSTNQALYLRPWVTGEFIRKARELLGGLVAGTNTHPGMALGTARLVDIVRVEEIRESLSAEELLLDNFSDGRIAFVFAEQRRFKKPFKVKGHPLLWNLDDAILKKHGEKIPQ